MCSGEVYDPLTNTWAPVPDMYNPRSNFAIEVIDDMIFAIGGFNGVTTIYHVECYDERTNEWLVFPSLNICPFLQILLMLWIFDAVWLLHVLQLGI